MKLFFIISALNLILNDAQIIYRDSDRYSASTTGPILFQTPLELKQNLLPKPGVCALFTLSTKIYGGNETSIEDFPWVALIEYANNGSSMGYHCGGSLINNRYVVTAGHCVTGQLPANWYISSVRLGEWDIQSENDCIPVMDSYQCSDPPLDVEVVQIIAHENYVPTERGQYNDIALLRLARRVKFTDWIKPICLPTTNNLRNSNFDGESFDVAGWGRTEFGIKSSVKLRAAIRTFPINNCKTMYSKYNISIESNIQICAGGINGIDTCRGDSGGPLIGLDTSKPELTNYFLAGVVSFGSTPCGLDWPGVYTKVGPYIEWIERTIQP